MKYWSLGTYRSHWISDLIIYLLLQTLKCSNGLFGNISICFTFLQNHCFSLTLIDSSSVLLINFLHQRLDIQLQHEPDIWRTFAINVMDIIIAVFLPVSLSIKHKISSNVSKAWWVVNYHCSLHVHGTWFCSFFWAALITNFWAPADLLWFCRTSYCWNIIDTFIHVHRTRKMLFLPQKRAPLPNPAWPLNALFYSKIITHVARLQAMCEVWHPVFL